MSKLAQVFPRLELVVAVADNGVIGADLGLPWRQRADLRHFKQLTMGHPIVMGRRTWARIGRALPGRLNSVLTRQPTYVADGATVVSSLGEAIAAAGGAPALMVIGGAELYAQALPAAAVLHLTELHGTPQGDVRFPAWNRGEWQETHREEHPADADNDYPYSFVRLARVPAPG